MARAFLALDRLGANPRLPARPGSREDGGEGLCEHKGRDYYYSNRRQEQEEGLRPPVQGGGEGVSWEGRGGFRLGFSHSLLSPQAWVFLRCELGGGCSRAELAEGGGRYVWHVPRAPMPGKEGGLLTPHPHSSGQSHFQGKCPTEQGPA